MTRPYSDDLRERVVASVNAGRSCRATAALFGVSVATVVRWSQRHRATGNSAALPMGGRRRLLLLPQRDWLLARIAAAPDLTVRGSRRIARAWHQDQLWGGLVVSRRRRAHLQKKLCMPPSRSAPRLPASARSGSGIRDGLIRAGWYLWMKPGPRRT